MVVAAALAAPIPPSPCRPEVVAPEKGPRREAFFAWLRIPGKDLDPEIASALEKGQAGERLALRIADIDNDGAEDYVLTTYEGSGGYLGLWVFHRTNGGWALVEESPLENDLAAVHDYFDPLSHAREVLLRFCGKTYLALLGGAGPNYSREAWLWQGGKTRLVCDPPWLAEQRRAFDVLFRHRLYDEAHGFLDDVQATCAKEASPATWLWMQSDLALTAYRMGTFADCLEHVGAAERSPAFAAADATVRGALRTSAGLCRAALDRPVASGSQFSWLLELARAPGRQAVLDPRFNRLLTAIVPDAKIDEGLALRDVLKQNLFLPDDTRVVDGRYVILSGCRPHDCGSKGFAWIDLATGKSVVAVNGLVASTTLAAADIPPAVWSGIDQTVGLPEQEAVTFIGRGGEKNQITAPARHHPGP